MKTLSTKLQIKRIEGVTNTRNSYQYYSEYFEHTRENGEVMLFKIWITDQYNDKDITLYLFSNNNFKSISNFCDIDGLQKYTCAENEEFIAVVNDNVKIIKEWVKQIFH